MEQNIKIIADYVKRKDPTIPLSAIYISIFTSISEMACFNRVRINYDNSLIFPNIYGMTFMGSGEGKDLLNNGVRSCIPFCKNKEKI